MPCLGSYIHLGFCFEGVLALPIEINTLPLTLITTILECICGSSAKGLRCVPRGLLLIITYLLEWRRPILRFGISDYPFGFRAASVCDEVICLQLMMM